MEQSKSPLALGLDLSTQSLKVVAINSQLQVVYRSQVHFDSELPHYKTNMGIHIKQSNQVTSPVLMFIEALDLLLIKMKSDKFPFNEVVAISGSGQQHGSVYWTVEGKKILENLSESEPLVDQFQSKKSFSLDDSPIWMDNSTTEYCHKLESFLQGPTNLAKKTGSKAYERFTGNQIAKIRDRTPNIYQNTCHISLISSFLAELFKGEFAQIDLSDGCGMNLLDLETGNWDSEICDFVGPNLQEKLGKPVPSHKVLGKINQYFVKKYGFNDDCSIVAFSGDNPNSLVGLGVFDEKDVCISLGTSDTIFGLVASNESNKSLEGHIFISPVDPKLHFVMICTKNGSSVRENIKRTFTSNTWDDFEAHLKQTPPGNEGYLYLMYDYPEIVPYVEGSQVSFSFDKNGDKIEKLNDNHIIRGVLEGKFVALKYHAAKKGLVPKEDGKIFVTGGGSKNKEILQILANIFQKEVCTIQVEDSAALGAAIRALHGFNANEYKEFLSFKELFSDFLKNRNQGLSVVKPDLSTKQKYQQLEDLYSKVLPIVTKQS